MGLLTGLFKSNKDRDSIIISKKELDKIKLNELNEASKKVSIIKGNNNKENEVNSIESNIQVPEGAYINEKGEIEYEIVEIEIRPEKIICPDCGGITLEGLEYCDQCGGEL